MGMKANMKAVTAGQILQLLIHDMGTVFLMRSATSGSVAPERKDCMPKKYELKKGVKRSWLMVTCCSRQLLRMEFPKIQCAPTFVVRDSTLEL
jgi:hypothetical protein